MSGDEAHEVEYTGIQDMIAGAGPEDHAERERLLWLLIGIYAGALTAVSENEKRGMERVLAILDRKIAEGGGSNDEAHNRFYRRRCSAHPRHSARERFCHWYKSHIRISLGTAGRGWTKARCPQVAAQVERQIAALRDGPKPHAQKQISALSGEMYKWFSQTFEDNPILPPEDWLKAAQLNKAAVSAENLKASAKPLLTLRGASPPTTAL